MQLGGCWLNSERQILITQSTGEVFELTADEFTILRLLVDHQEKVVSKALLLRELTGHANAELELVDIIYNLRGYLGTEYAGLIETVADQGYILHARIKRHSRPLSDSPFKTMSVLVYSFLTGVILLLMFWIYSEVDHPYCIDSYFAEQVPVGNGHAVEFSYYPIDYHQKKVLKPQMEHFVRQLKACQFVPWDTVSLSVSVDGMLTNIMLLKQTDKRPEFDNIKLFQKGVELDFINPVWLKEVGVCG